MRSLPILLIALALLPLSDALQCKVKASSSGLPPASRQRFYNHAAHLPPVETCAPGIEYCAAFSGVDKGGAKFEAAACEDVSVKCAEEGCTATEKELPLVEGSVLMFVGHTCCCKGDMCTPPTPPPSFSPKFAGSGSGSGSGAEKPAQ
ncbi:hypothetical protein PRIPAC_88734 [Pristionchus pacificus]|uniref:Uncharacterized protein n=1 Tax=Pristionchus pacificus TaxID=54126 RepID=A0A454XPV2_PRIPA|nr:hypothetical protein PRIPAC_88734 [Pristionchus pacificus]|eukprot:PDM61627.1 hypothetical protein PRIPAC_51069 [Pristionchus pacificus]